MNPETAVELARTAGTAIVGAMATDTWNRTRDGIVALWRRAHPEGTEQVGSQLDATRDDLLNARARGDELSEAELRAEWQGRVRRLLVEHPDLAATLRALLEEAGALPAGRNADVGEVRMSARATGNGRVYQAGRDQHITER
ncbi:hypothetical protein Shyhy01_15440 [Streptomyces hygroscopicus subsp. hygroscopicus]|uniref:hypothetical protein n=1 Tax=Streptomyces sp. KHY 26 TaxID=3097359 RepID=UPI0024A025C4|nr:hypothetical protein [Streptomyces hygroscopicus]GLX48594.1 hypothetical protein Shyhy01_15440 [Streptomyces hygroscopicus subsp. hygroscopicus]